MCTQKFRQLIENWLPTENGKMIFLTQLLFDSARTISWFSPVYESDCKWRRVNYPSSYCTNFVQPSWPHQSAARLLRLKRSFDIFSGRYRFLLSTRFMCSSVLLVMNLLGIYLGLIVGFFAVIFALRFAVHRFRLLACFSFPVYLICCRVGVTVSNCSDFSLWASYLAVASCPWFCSLVLLSSLCCRCLNTVLLHLFYLLI